MRRLRAVGPFLVGFAFTFSIAAVALPSNGNESLSRLRMTYTSLPAVPMVFSLQLVRWKILPALVQGPGSME